MATLCPVMEWTATVNSKKKKEKKKRNQGRNRDYRLSMVVKYITFDFPKGAHPKSL